MSNNEYLVLRCFQHNGTYYCSQFSKNLKSFYKTVVNADELGKELVKKFEKSFHIINLDLPEIPKEYDESKFKKLLAEIQKKADKIKDDISKASEKYKNENKGGTAKELDDIGKFLYQYITVYGEKAKKIKANYDSAPKSKPKKIKTK